ncbi:hypothetical protein NDN08_003661 [Rhodosorus marinus]|uniref:4-(cytidine 5'-diphospho)-2-C-methyl-D-erythritol kinase n=1 Tax=Rhodosorus marinus TaxID=101924 RepID=A0AAV8UYQ5_9RHOD|nr:hypothetical protein NDN08_003661 [Rhodosorus marinus]
MAFVQPNFFAFKIAHRTSPPRNRAWFGRVRVNREEGRRWDLELVSPCKINLFLRIIRKREDGYHELASMFQAISLHDDLLFDVLPDDAEGDQLECEDPNVPLDRNNLVLKAIDVFRKRTGRTEKFRVKLNKRVPVQAGLGGGSANAATALWGVNQLCGKIATNEELADYGAEIGSDISFFFSLGTAYCTGRGEKLENVSELMPTSLYIIKPKEGLSTGEVFKNLDIASIEDRDPLKLKEKLEQESIYTAEFVNDLEVPSFKLCPKLADIKQASEEAGFKVVLMSGSGTSFFCLGEPHRDFVEIFEERMKELFNVDIYQTRFLNRKDADHWYLQS